MNRTIEARHPLLRACLALLVLAGGALPVAHAQERFITVASTTSTEQSGLFGHLLPAFKAATGIDVRVVAVGTGQALEIGRRGDADVLLVHDRAAELRFVADGFGIERRDVMYNDFVVVGPRADPARVAGTKDIAAALRAIARAEVPFVSRGDQSGTHMAELRHWRDAGVDPLAGQGRWYRQIGQAMGAALNTAAASDAYTLSDRGTWLSFRNRQNLVVVVQDDPKLFNQYGVILVNPARQPHVKKELGMRFVEWITSPQGQRAIGAYRIDGEQLFFPNHVSSQRSSVSRPPAWIATVVRARTTGLARNATDSPARAIIARSFAPSPIAMAREVGTSSAAHTRASSRALPCASTMSPSTCPVSRPSTISSRLAST